MPKQLFALEDGGAKRLELSWKMAWRNFTVKLDDMEIGRIEGGQKGLKAGKIFPLPDGSDLSIQLKQKPFSLELQTLRDGQPLPGSASDPQQKLEVAYGIIFFVGGLSIVLTLAGLLFTSEFLQSLGYGWGTAVFGVILIGLGFMVKRRSLVSLWLAMLLYALDGILGFTLAVSAGATPGMGGLIMRFFFIAAMYQGVGAIRQLN